MGQILPYSSVRSAFLSEWGDVIYIDRMLIWWLFEWDMNDFSIPSTYGDIGIWRENDPLYRDL